jgi:hypothetical protein
VLVDNELCTFKIVSAEEDSFWGFMLTVYCENKTTDKTLRFSADNVSVNGYLIDPYWSEDVDAGDKKNDDMTFNSDEFKKVGFTTPEEIKFTLRVYDSDTWSDENFVKENFTIYPTGKSAGEVTYPERKQEPGEQVAVDNENFTFIILNEENDDFWGYSLNCFFENKTDKTLMVTWDECTVNGSDTTITDGKGIVDIKGGKITITKAGDDGIQAYNYVFIRDSVSTPTINVTSTGKGIVSENRVYINAGKIDISSGDDGVHSNMNIYFNGGYTTIAAPKNDGVHADSTLTIND